MVPKKPKPMSRGKSRRDFRKKSGVHPSNQVSAPMRGGWRR